MSKVEHAHTMANLPVLAGFIANSKDSADWLVRWCQRELILIETLVGLVVCMTEAGCADFRRRSLSPYSETGISWVLYT